jgi:O-antigen/teichoic acid export membrane protein
MAAGLGLAHVHSPVAYGLILAVAPLISVAVTAPQIRAAMAAGSRLAWGSFVRPLLPLTASTLLAQLVVNIGVIDLRLLDPGADALAGAILDALVLARIPLFAFASMQASLLPGLAALVAVGDRAGYRRLLLRGCAIVLGLAVLGGVPATFLGPWLVRFLFAAAPVLGPGDFAIMATGTGAYLLAQVLGQGVLALGRHRDQTLAWLGGTLALVVVTLLPGAVKLRVEGGYAVGSLVVALILVAASARRGSALPDHSRYGPTALVAIGGAD